ncbi:MAG: hypothetical protein Kow00124_11570 [Anaerolineae bacterium]
MNVFARLRERIGAVIAAVVGSGCFLIMGAFLAFFISPQQAAEWRRIDALPDLDPAGLAAVPQGKELYLTGTLTGNTPLKQDLVLYQVDVWDITTDSEGDKNSSWNVQERRVPALTLDFQGTTVSLLPNDGATLGGAATEYIEEGPGPESDTYNGRSLPEGSLRTWGFTNSALVTVVGTKQGDAVAPSRFFGGTHDQLVENIRTGARAAFITGIVMMAISPIILIGSVIGAIFGKGRGKVRLGAG